jgi:2-dehydro-3-deoxyglucarate aldolase/4-hydroxy-2-oxoheptanedioate aldolase
MLVNEAIAGILHSNRLYFDRQRALGKSKTMGVIGMDYKNRTLSLLREGKPAFGMFQGMASIAVSEILADNAFDWILIDMEHGQMGIETAGNLFKAISRGGPTPLVRVAGNDQAIIKRALDAGAMGVMVPLVNSPEEALRAVQYCRYPPQGTRGLGPGRASLYGIHMARYVETANEEILVMVQAEHKDAVDRIDEIVRVSGVDMIFVGPFDMACSMGHAGNPGHPEVEKAIARVLDATLKAGRIPGIFCMNVESALKRVEQGFKFVAMGLDSLYLHESVSRAVGVLPTSGFHIR